MPHKVYDIEFMEIFVSNGYSVRNLYRVTHKGLLIKYNLLLINN